jgi:hypothetical protein
MTRWLVCSVSQHGAMTRVLRSLLVRVDSREIELSSSAQSLQYQDLPALVCLQNPAIPFSSSDAKRTPDQTHAEAQWLAVRHQRIANTLLGDQRLGVTSPCIAYQLPICRSRLPAASVAPLCVPASSDQSTAIGCDTGRWPLRQRGSPSNRTWPPESESRIVTPNPVAITGLREHLSQFCGFSVEEAGNAQRIAARLWRTLPWQAPP